MQRAWATGGEHDRGPLEWVEAIREDSNVVEHIRGALDAVIAPEATLEQCQAGMLAIECVTYLQGGDADLHPMVHQWILDRHPNADEKLREVALGVLAKLVDRSTLASHWSAEPEAKQTEWVACITNLRERLVTAKRKPDPRKDKRIVAFASNFNTAKKHLRVALVPYEIRDEPIVHVKIAPGLSVVIHYAEVGDLEPIAVPIEHARAWKKTEKAIAKLAAKQTHEVSGIRTHIVEHDGFEIDLAFGNSSFTAGLLAFANLLLLEEKQTPYGMLVAAPNAGTVIFHRIADASWNPAAVEIVKQVTEIYEKSAQRLTPSLWWWHEGKVIELPYQVVAGNVMIQPIESFVECVKKLG